MGGSHHLVDDTGSLSDRTALEAHVSHILDHLGDRDISALEFIKVYSTHFLCSLGHGARGDENRLGRRGGGRGSAHCAGWEDEEGGWRKRTEETWRTSDGKNVKSDRYN